MELNENYEMEKSVFLVQIQNLQKDIFSLSSCSLAKEKENIRKDLEKTKLKLKEVEFKLKNDVQEKTKLEGEKACAEREVKRLHGQKALLERNMSKRDTILDRRHETTKDRNSNVFDQKRAKDSASAELEMQELSHELDLTRSELCSLKEEVSALKTSLEESRIYGQELESSLKYTLEEKDELSMQLAEPLLTMEEEKAIWMSKEKASVEVLEERTKLYTAEIYMLSEELLQVRNELGICVKYSKDIEERFRRSEEASSAKCSGETLSVVYLTSNEPRASDDECERYIEEGMILKLKQELAEQNDKFTSLEAQIHKDTGVKLS